MKFVSGPLIHIAGCVLALFLAACDVAPDYRLGGDALNDPDRVTDALDPADEDSIIGYFYAGAQTGSTPLPAVPVDGLYFVCSRGSQRVKGFTNENGRFVCPIGSTVRFYVGEPSTALVSLGAVDLGMYGTRGDPSDRNNVVITPGTLYGTAVDSSRREVANVFNMLASFDGVDGHASQLQKTLIIPRALHDKAAGYSEFTQLTLTDSVGLFARDLRKVVERLNTEGLISLRLMTDRPSAPVLEQTEAEILANDTLLRVRSGYYRDTAQMSNYPDEGDGVFRMHSVMRLDRFGNVSGFVATRDQLSSNATPILELLTSLPGGRVMPDGRLEAVQFGPLVSNVTFVGSFVNDFVFGESRLCNDSSPNALIPATYCQTPALQGGFEVTDIGEFTTPKYSGELYLGKATETLPDIDLDELPDHFLPRTYALKLSYYDDIDRADFMNEAYITPEADKAAFGDLVEMSGEFRYTLLPNGDIVSDADSDCSGLSFNAAGHYQDAEGDREYLIGRVSEILKKTLEQPPGSVLPAEVRTYLTLHIVVLDQDAPHFGLNLGFRAMAREGYPVVLGLTDNKILPKSCGARPDEPCEKVVEWFNDVEYFQEVHRKELLVLYGQASGAQGSSTPPECESLTVQECLDVLHQQARFYGQVKSNHEIYHAASPICRVESPPTP